MSMTRVLRDPRLWVAVGLLCLSLFIWILGASITFGEPPQPVPVSFRVISLVFLYLAAGAAWFIFHLQARRANAAVLAAMGTEDSSASVEAEEKQLREKFAQATAVLKNHRFASRQGKRQIFQLPWYIVIGSPGSGKTTAIANSGLDFPLASVLGTGSLTGTGGTRNCDWWITSEAVLLDTAGRYTTQSSNKSADAKGWNNFLELLRVNRKRQPINGAVMVISVDELLNYSEEHWQQHLQTLKQRLQELGEKLSQSFPVYLVVTKMDLLAGFREFFDTLATEEQSQVWGATLPVGADGSSLLDEVRLIAQRLHEQLPHKLRQERDQRRRQAIYHFPWQFEQLTGRLRNLTETVFSRNAFILPQDLRGVYFTSAVQQGSPIERVFAGVTNKFGLDSHLATTARGSRTLFLKQIFQHVIFNEASLASTNALQEKRLRLFRSAAILASLAVGTALIFTWSSAYFLHKNTLTQAREQIGAYLATNPASTDLADTLASLEQLAAAMKLLDQRSHPFISSLGMYDASADEAARNAYRHALKTRFLSSLGQAIAADLRMTRDFAQAYGLLKAYLMLQDIQHRDHEYLANSAAGLSGIRESAKNADVLRHFLAQLTHLEPNYALHTLDDVTIAQARELLQQVSPAQRVYWQMQTAYAGQLVDLRQELGPAFAETFSVTDQQILLKPAFFTRAVYEKLDFSSDSEHMNQLTDDQWVLGNPRLATPESSEEIAQQVKTLYLTDYLAQWHQLYQGLSLPVPEEPASYLRVVGKLADPAASPLVRLALMTARETDLPNTSVRKVPQDMQDKLTAAAADKLSASSPLTSSTLTNMATATLGQPVPPDPLVQPLRQAFGPIQRMPQGEAASLNNKMLAALDEFRQWYSSIYMSNDPAAAALQSIEGNALFNPTKKLMLLSADLPQPYNEWVASIGKNAQASLTAKATGALNAGWKSAIGDTCRERFGNRFPFALDAKSDVSLAAFSEFFKPGGIEDNYVRQNIAKYLNKPNSSIPSRATRSAITQAQRIRETFFRQDTGALGFRYSLTPDKMDPQILKISIEIAGDYIEYSHGPKLPTDLVWPDTGNGIAVTFQLADGRVERATYEGPWALHHLAYEAKENAANSISLSTGLYSATFRLSTRSPHNPFAPAMLSAYHCRDRL